ncbi:V-set and immunoglobulin domain-containing protein 1-like isoform X1 [Pocillopora damicornis]|uniref:V-set and immunoglobulin domain-containing protein 1-like isoform X1 n=1 Tax=Pocillopora damicornis TaxID=46731 RepID=UPI000F54D660|nr:V-set and immunoglobulin domain-containing protein 1-like isoform X1 [Pocillopora damicornis]
MEGSNTTWVLLFFLNCVILLEGFQWSYQQQANHVINVVAGSNVSLPCDYVLTPQEEQQANIFHLLTWSREQPYNSDEWAGLAINSTLIGSKVIYDHPQHIFISDRTLNVMNVAEEDHTRYQCSFRSSFFTSPSIIELNVQYKPTDTLLSSSVEPAQEGKLLVLTCTARANPSAEYKFYRNNNLISSSSTGVLTFVSVKKEDQGTYRCVPSNKLGHGPEATLTVTVEDKEEFPVWAYAAIGGSVLFVLLIASSIVVFCRSKKHNKKDKREMGSQNNISRQGTKRGSHIGPTLYGDQTNGGMEIGYPNGALSLNDVRMSREFGYMNGAISLTDVRMSREMPDVMKGAMSANDIRLAEDQRSTVGGAYPTRSVIQLIEAEGEVDSRI